MPSIFQLFQLWRKAERKNYLVSGVVQKNLSSMVKLKFVALGTSSFARDHH